MLRLFNRKKKLAVDESMPIHNVRFVVVDTELTGLDEKKDSIVSIGAVRMVGGSVRLGDQFYRLVSPETALKADSVRIHEITPSDVAEQPGIESALGDFLAYVGNDVLVGHFISIDLSFLNRGMKRIYGHELPNPVLDTFSIYEWLRKRQKARDCFATPVAGYRLYDIIKCFDIPVHGAHNAIMDAFATAQLFQRFIPYLSEAGALDLGELLKVGKPFEGGDQFNRSGEFGNF
jgi:DNA polymerase III subunit epsilon